MTTNIRMTPSGRLLPYHLLPSIIPCSCGAQYYRRGDLPETPSNWWLCPNCGHEFLIERNNTCLPEFPYGPNLGNIDRTGPQYPEDDPRRFDGLACLREDVRWCDVPADERAPRDACIAQRMHVCGMLRTMCLTYKRTGLITFTVEDETEGD